LFPITVRGLEKILSGCYDGPNVILLLQFFVLCSVAFLPLFHCVLTPMGACRINLSLSSVDAVETVTCPLAMRRTSLLPQIFWPLCALMLSVFVVLALPGQRVALGASQLKGLVGSYTGHGNWTIIAATSGSANWQLNHSMIVRYGELSEYVNGQAIPLANVDLSRGTQVETYTGGASTAVDIKIWLGTMNGSADAHLNLAGANINYWLQFSRSLDNLTEPAPKKVVLYYRRKITVTGGAGANINPPSGVTSAAASYSMLGSIGSLGDNAADQFTAPPDSSGFSSHATKSDNPFIRLELDSSSGSVSLNFNLSGSVNVTSDVEGGVDTATGGEAELNLGVDLCVAGFDLARFGGPMRTTGGDNRLLLRRRQRPPPARAEHACASGSGLGTRLRRR
jgi:hypothetical protein